MLELKPIKNFEDYQIANTGYVLSFKYDPSGIILKFGYKGGNHKNSYRYINLSKNNTMYPRTIHRLVAEHFVANPENRPEVNHKDGDKLNNHYTNLEWVTRKENAEHAALNGLYPRGETQPSSKFRESDIIAIREMYSRGMTATKIKFKYPVRYETIKKIINRITWKHIA